MTKVARRIFSLIIQACQTYDAFSDPEYIYGGILFNGMAGKKFVMIITKT